ncbi:hypothetical protein Hanom_Chr07g00631361 [Helianthus anomalus]
MITSPSSHFTFQNPTQKHEDEEPLILTFGQRHFLDIDRWHSRREFLKSYQLSHRRSRLKEQMKKCARKIRLRVYKLTFSWPSVCVLRCYVPLPCMEVQVVSQDHMHGDNDVFQEHVSHGFVHRKSIL